MDIRANFLPTTKGEHLFRFVATNVIGKKHLNEIYALNALQIGNRGEDLAEYYSGILAANILSRCIKKANKIVSEIESEVEQQKILVNYFQSSLELPRTKGSGDLDRLAFLTIEAERSTRSAIGKSLQQEFSKQRIHFCYICGIQLSSDGSSDIPKLQLEHIWPRSLGGDSILDNLLPACLDCNRKKGDMFIWQSSHAHGQVLRSTPSISEIEHYPRRERIALYLRSVFRRAQSLKITLKQAALDLGSVDIANIAPINREDSVDFFNIRQTN